jgi:drug/metabolite transporter (DMT)-like permease
LLWLGLGLALVSAVAVNWAYAKEHDAAAQLPPLTFREPVASVRSLLGAPAWLLAFGVETVGFLLYVLALRLAPLSLVQAVAASGIAVLAFVSCGGRVDRLSWRERTAVLLACVGLALLGLSVTGEAQADHAPSVVGVLIWLPSCAAAALLAVRALPAGVPAARFGLAAGLLFAAGDISAKLVGYGGGWLSAILPIIVCYGLGTSVLQAAFQRGAALTAAGIATLTTNAVPIAAGFVLFGEELPQGAAGALQIAAFSTVVASATLLGRRA